MKTIRLIELFAGIGSQAKALERLGYPFEHHVVCEIDKLEGDDFCSRGERRWVSIDRR